MALLFVYNRSSGDTLSEILGLKEGEFKELHEKLFDMVKEDIEMNFNPEVDDEAEIVQSRLEYAQALAEYLKRDLTPELGLLIGIVIADAEKMTEQIMTHLGMGREIKGS